MEILWQNDDLKVVFYDGVIEVLGQGSIIGNTTVNNSRINVARTYDYIRILEDDGVVRTLPHMTVYNEVDSYLSPHLRARIYTLEPFDKNEKSTIVGLDMGERRIIDVDDLMASIEAADKLLDKMLPGSYVGVLLGAIGSFVLIGIPVLIASLAAVKKLRLAKKKIAEFPTADAIRQIVEASMQRHRHGEELKQTASV